VGDQPPVPKRKLSAPTIELDGPAKPDKLRPEETLVVRKRGKDVSSNSAASETNSSAPSANAASLGSGSRDVTPSTLDLLRPGRILGSYVLQKKIGEGALAHVYLAEHTSLKRRVALKILKPEAEAKKMSVRRFFAEARTVNQIEHENIVAITDFVEGPPSYYVMEYLEGETLDVRIRREGSLPLPAVTAILEQLSRALRAVHREGMVHRDLKPANIFLRDVDSEQPQVKLLDFGIAKLADDIAEEAGVKTNAGVLIGTPEYMSPEQAIAVPVDSRTDIYALGLLCFEMLVGRSASSPTSFADALRFAREGVIEPPSSLREMPTDFSDSVDSLVASCCQKNPAQRFQTMDEFLENLDVLQKIQNKVPTKPLGNVLRLALLVLLMSLLGFGFMGWMQSRANEAAQSGVGIPTAIPARTVQLQFQSQPPGATVIRIADQKVLGITPLSIVMDRRSDDRAKFSFTLPDRQPSTVNVTLDRDQTIRVQLVSSVPALRVPIRVTGDPEPAVSRKRMPKKKARRRKTSKTPQKRRLKAPKPVDKVETLNPFAND